MKRTINKTYASFLMYGVATSALLAPVAALAVNINPTLESGSATISQAGNITTVNQATQKAIYNATSLDTTAAEALNVNMAQGISSIGLFKVSGAATKFDGALNSNGQVWVVNPNGMIFGSTAKVNVGGLLVSTAGISNDNFLNPLTGANGGKKYVFDQAGNPQAAIVVKSGAQITAKYPDGTFEVQLSEKGGEIGVGGRADTGALDAQDLTNWILTPGTTVDSKNTNDWSSNGDVNPWGYDKGVYDPQNHPQFFDLDGTNDTGRTWQNGTQGFKPAQLTSKKSFDLAPGEYKINFDSAGNHRVDARDAMLIEVIDVNNNVLFSNRKVYNKEDAWANTTLAFNLDHPVTGLKLRVTGEMLDQPKTWTNDNTGVSLGKLDFSYRPYENPYVTFMAAAVKQETGSNVQALKVDANGHQISNGIINYAAGTTFEANHVNGTTVDRVKINDPVRMAAIIDGKPATSAIEIQQGAQLWAALVPDSPLGEVILQAKVEQGVFNTNFDKNADGINNHMTTVGPVNQVYDSSEIITIANGADIRPSPVGNGTPAVTTGAGTGDSPTVTTGNGLTISSGITPGGVLPPVVPPVVPPVTPPVTPPATTPVVNQNQQISPPVQATNYAQVSARDVVSRNFVNAQDSVNPLVSVNNGLSLTPNGTAGGAVNYAALAPAAGNPGMDYAALSPAAGSPAPAVAPAAVRYAAIAPTKPATKLVKRKVVKRGACGDVVSYKTVRVASNKSAPKYAELAPAAGAAQACTPVAAAPVAPAPMAAATDFSNLAPAAGARNLGGTGQAVNVSCANATLDTGFLGARPECRPTNGQ